MKSLKNMDEKIFGCFICKYNCGLLSLFVEDLKIVIVSRIKRERSRVMSDKKVKSVEKILSKFKKAGIHRVVRVSYNGAFIGLRRFEITHSAILELLDEQVYEIRN